MNEIFCSDLPSQCNIYMSSKQSTSRRRHSARANRSQKGGKQSSVPLVRFATERHSLTLKQKHIYDDGGDEYSLSVSRLPSSPRREEGAESNRISNGRDKTCGDTCLLAHSSVSWEDAIAYQVDFDVVDCGKTIPSSKRRIKFVFGYLHGSKHEVIATWSFSSGKQVISVDGKELFRCNDSDASPPTSKLHYAWRDNETGNSLELNVHEGPMSLKATPDSDWRQYDLLVDGISFFQMPKLSEVADDSQHQGSIEVFAMARAAVTENDAKEQKTSDNASLITHESHSVSEGGKDGGKTTHQRSQSIDSAVPTTKDEAGGNVGSKNNVKDCASSNHFLAVKSRFVGADKAKTTSAIEEIPLNFRPMSVHAAELHVSTDAKGSEGNSLSRCTAIGIFVASADDNTLHFYVTTKEALQKSAAAERNTRAPCYVPVPLSSESQDAVDIDDDPLTFSTPIMAIDTVTSDECSADQEKSDMKVNHLAVACYDGTVRILTFQLKANCPNNNNANESVRFCHLQCSTFIVDGPVVSIHFGRASVPESLVPQTSLFLVAGSLCGFACLFYESSQPPSDNTSWSDGKRYFDGPVTVVDGLYDARREGYEDCVTSVHACCDSGNIPIIAVGTQGGRVLIFRRCQKQNVVQNGSEDRAMTVQEKNELASAISQHEKDTSRLKSEKEEMEHKARELKLVTSEMQSKLEQLTNALQSANTESLEQPNSSDGALDSGDGECSDDSTTKESKVKCDEACKCWRNCSGGCFACYDPPSPASAQGDETIKPKLDDSAASNELSNLETKLNAVQTELSTLEQNMADHTSKIGELLTSAMENLTKGINAKKRTNDNSNVGNSTNNGRNNTRRMHRYTFVREEVLPYPIQGISSHYDDECGGLMMLVSTRRTFHVFELLPEFDAAALSIDETVASLEEKLSQLLDCSLEE